MRRPSLPSALFLSIVWVTSAPASATTWDHAGDVIWDLGGGEHELEDVRVYVGSLTVLNGTLFTGYIDLDGDDSVGGTLRISTEAQLIAGRAGIGVGGDGWDLGVFEVVNGGYAYIARAWLGEYQCCVLGRALVDGSGSQWSVGELIVSSDGDGEVVVQNGGLLTTTEAVIAEESDSSNGGGAVLVTGDRSTWINGGDLTVGAGFGGHLTIESDGFLLTTNLFVATGDPTYFHVPWILENGIVSVAGTGSLLRSWASVAVGGDLQGGDLGTIGRLHVTDGGQVAIADKLVLWNDSTVELAQGSVDIGTVLAGAPPGVMRIQSGGTLAGTGNVIADVQIEGWLEPGVSGEPEIAQGIHTSLLGTGATDDKPRLLEIQGDLDLEDSANLRIAIGASASSGPGIGFDSIAVSGTADLDGLLYVSVPETVWEAIAPGDEFVVLSAGALTGGFSNVSSGGTLPTYPGSIRVFYGPGSPFGANQVVLTKPPACGDGVDNDGDGFTDYPSDPGCRDQISVAENPRCQDGLNNDNQTGIDFDGGASLNGGTPIDVADPECTLPWRNRESPGCGLGFELVLLAPLFARLARRRRA